MRRLPWLFVLLWIPVELFADVVVPTPDVTTRVIVRETASGQSAQVGSLLPGAQAELIGSVPNWYQVRLANGTTGFVPKRWTDVRTTNTPPAPTPPAASPTFTLDVVDVGTGLAVLVRGPDFILVYDAGSNDDLAQGADNRMLAYLRLVVPALQTIDHVILSHPHQDHVALLPDLFGAYQVRQVWDSGRINDICAYRAFLTAVRDEPGVQYHNALQDFGTHDYSFDPTKCSTLPSTVHLTQGSRITDTPITLGQQATMTFLYADGSNRPSVNQNTLVVRLNLGNTRILFMGDGEAGGRQLPTVPPTPSSIEGTLLACCTSDLAANILIVGHHGSKTSSRKAFLDAVNPNIMVVSAGPHPYQTVTLPDNVIINELQQHGQVFRTDNNDHTCETNTNKVGPDNDGKPGGCDNIRITITNTSATATIVHP